ncbi:C3a anaphylatoxin chemotactic receptor-like [Oreochromis niloticus]|uniref:Formyl peptide receptor 1 n=1 Tax=Oreochromis niloticus TaxID=8128 RepID=A0A669DZF4_ORENI|nr:C3a anaphylatoxin chemotactic receptor-like [Oreochromis niloticus]
MEMTTRSFHQLNTTTAPVYQYAELRHSLNTMCAIFLSLVSVLGVLGNGVVIWVAGFKMKKTVKAVWFLNLAVADFFFCALLPITVTSLLLSHWSFGQVMCKLNTTLGFLNLSVSVSFLVVISVDRCVSVVWPVWAHNHRNVRKASYVSLCVWMVNLIFSIPWFFFMETKEMNDTKAKTICLHKFDLHDDFKPSSFIQLALVSRFLLGFAVPFSAIVSCYAVTIHRLRRSSTLARKSSHTFKIITAIIIAFFLCWAPIHIMGLIELEKHRSAATSGTLEHVLAIGIPITICLACLNSCLNPLLYVFMGQDFKNQVHKSIHNILETAFQEEVPPNATTQNNKKSGSDTQL